MVILYIHTLILLYNINTLPLTHFAAWHTFTCVPPSNHTLAHLPTWAFLALHPSPYFIFLLPANEIRVDTNLFLFSSLQFVLLGKESWLFFASCWVSRGLDGVLYVVHSHWMYLKWFRNDSIWEKEKERDFIHITSLPKGSRNRTLPPPWKDFLSP